ncbi:2-oxoglutarate dehydrogenase E1 component [Aromatoleum petrolei]|uniref:oxoglutarate dehydrogenase (succinyl-transferring) n=1 Tax=Aromatoleum petrolei TaxID=76116 RepID=A0ABX1MJE4_9RHOO|nr:2-oxoglutarate dehydrogenase E1 component [Aromatoleum petrolei]NMF88072.1 2-oxoglutarate dehydrogenase E1 component [Aromatoleum petrolei]QTQ38857.1 2-oxoglutarate dehydrogenase E1 component [Aromatoleum petrolei]
MTIQQRSTSHLFGSNAPFIEELYENYLSDPASVPESWRAYFDNLQSQSGAALRDVAHGPVIAAFAEMAKRGAVRTVVSEGDDKRQVSTLQLINAYRFLGNRWANLDPLRRTERPHIAELEPSYYGFTEADLSHSFNTGSFHGFSTDHATLREILEAVRQTYCGSVGSEYMYISDISQKRWIQARLESVRATPRYDAAKKKRILERTTAAETLERYLHTRYVGQKRFSLEGGESAIVAMDELISVAGSLGAQEVVIGMAHRGRLNVLVNTLGKSPSMLFSEFEGKAAADLTAGDVKYHMGFSSDVMTSGGPMHLTLAFNPSHLEIINPVVEGSVYARQVRRSDEAKAQVIPVLIHGDAAVAGQGVNQEMLNFSQTRGYGTGGTIHIVINNQIGFTTSDPRDYRSSLYCTDIFKMVEAPIFHVNGDDPEAVAFATKLAVEFRQEFQKDVVLDIICFRKLGHNEQDEPMVTQPLMYRTIQKHPGTRKLYADRLVAEGTCQADEPDRMIAEYREHLDRGELLANPVLPGHNRQFSVDWTPFLKQPYTDACDTAIPVSEIKRLGERLSTVPETFALHSRVKKIIDDRAGMARGDLPLDWGMGENLAYASLLAQGYRVRISGEDVGRGTFFHRHAVLHDQKRERWDEGIYKPLDHIQDGQAGFQCHDSVLSEEAVLAFEYGYSTTEPNELVVWEAQFGDFVNGAQVVIDQFISSGEAKWGRLSGLVMMLPHGYEGQGPEHSSCRPERFMSLAAENNWQICVPTTPAQVFHLLRRQMLRKVRKPLIIVTPKSLLRHKEAISTMDELATGSFQTVIPEVEKLDPKKVKRVVLCQGKIYYELQAHRRENKITDTALVRIEQIYPFPTDAFAAAINQFPNAKEVVWCQEEPRNQGAWYWLASRQHLINVLGTKRKLLLVSRPASASPAVGYYAKHNAQQKAVLENAFGPIQDTTQQSPN